MSKAQSGINNLDFSKIEGIAVSQKKIAAPKKPEGSGGRANKITAKDFLAEKTAQALNRKGMELEARVLQEVLPFWDDESRGVPNPFIRSGLFSVKNTEKREFMKNMQISSLSNYNISYSGQDLQQDDLSVWMSLINLARNQPMSDSVLFTGYQLVKDLGWRMHSESYRRAQESIERLKVTGIEISTNNKDTAYSGSLIREYAWTARDEKGNAKWMVRFEPRVSILFMDDTTTLLEWETRKKLGTRATVAQWLHSFYSSHRDPIPLSEEKIHELCRSSDTLSSFRRTLALALTKLVAVEFLETFTVIKGQVHVKKRAKPKLIRAK